MTEPLATATPRLHTRRRLLQAAGAAAGALLFPWGAGLAGAEPMPRQQWVANHVATRLLGADGKPVAWLPQFTRMRLIRALPGNLLEVWVDRIQVIGRVATSDIGPVQTPTAAQLAEVHAERFGPPLSGRLSMPGRVSGGGNLRLWPLAQPNTLLRTLGHNAPLWVLESVDGDDGEEWFDVRWLDGVTQEILGAGYLHHSVVRLPRLRPPMAADRMDVTGKWFEADLKEPAMLVAFEDGVPIWSTLALHGTIANRTPTGSHKILWRVPNETMTSERVYPPIARDAPGGYYLQNVLFTQYFTADGASIHYNYWSSNWGYAGSHGCLGVAYNEAKWAWDWAAVGTKVRVFA